MKVQKRARPAKRERTAQLADVLAERDRLRVQLADLRQQFDAVEADRAARLAIIEEQASLAELRQLLETSEADRAARLAVIERQGKEIEWLQAEVHRWLEQTKELSGRLGGAEAERAAAQAGLAELRQHFETAEADRAARLVIIERQGEKIASLQAEVHRELEENQRLGQVSERKERARLSVIEKLGTQLGQLQQQLEAAETDRATSLALIEQQEREIGHLQAQLRTLQQVLQAIQCGRAYRLLRRLGRWGFVEDLIGKSPTQ